MSLHRYFRCQEALRLHTSLKNSSFSELPNHFSLETYSNYTIKNAFSKQLGHIDFTHVFARVSIALSSLSFIKAYILFKVLFFCTFHHDPFSHSSNLINHTLIHYSNDKKKHYSINKMLLLSITTLIFPNTFVNLTDKY